MNVKNSQRRRARALSLLSACLLSITWACGGSEATPETKGSGGHATHDSTGLGGQVANSVVSANATSTASGAPTGDGCLSGTLQGGTQRIELEHDGLTRAYRLHLPSGYQPGTAVPLVMNFHGFTMTVDLEVSLTGMDDEADAKGYAVVYPEGIAYSWNGGSLCCGAAAQQEVDDVGFARRIVEDISARACIDTKRVYATGFSNGGFLSHRIACEASDLVAAIAPVAGLLAIPLQDCNPQRPVPVVHFYGVDDQLVDYTYANDVNEMWVDRNGCTEPAEITVQAGQTVCETHKECNDGATVTLCSVAGMGHCWPGRPDCPYGVSNVDISANDIMWKLFEQHALP